MVGDGLFAVNGFTSYSEISGGKGSGRRRNIFATDCADSTDRATSRRARLQDYGTTGLRDSDRRGKREGGELRRRRALVRASLFSLPLLVPANARGTEYPTRRVLDGWQNLS